MKNLKSIFVFVLLAGQVSLFANEIKNPLVKTPSEFIFTQSKDEVKINYLNLDSSNVKIIVRDGFERIIYSLDVTEKQSIHKLLDFSKAYSGTYSISLKDNTENYSFQITVG